MKATQDFIEDGVSVKAGEEITPGMFDADRIESLLAKGLITEPKQPKPITPAKSAGKDKSK